ncbi:MAG TPA: PHB depolymerase family esterase [Burkholderiaceae bacterium]|nr:PHB depolymerase family esterase [Burkholderiaceae bacterium]
MKPDFQSLMSEAQPGNGAKSDNFTSHSHDDAAGHRGYKLFVPSGLDDRPVPLVVMLHGCSQNPDDFAAGTAMNEVARAQGFIVLYPAQSQQANSNGCWNWFKHTHQERGRGEPAVLAGMTRAVMARHAIDPDRVYIAGLSAGGAMAAILGDSYPDIFAAVGVHSGLATGVAKDLPAAVAAMKNGGSGTRGTRGTASGVATIVFHGDADTTVHPGNGNHIIMASAGMASSVEEAQLHSAGGLATTRRVYRAPDDGRVIAEHWLVHGAAHAWSGGNPNGSFTDARGPDASAEMIRFFKASHRPAIR